MPPATVAPETGDRSRGDTRGAVAPFQICVKPTAPVAGTEASERLVVGAPPVTSL